MRGFAAAVAAFLVVTASLLPPLSLLGPPGPGISTETRAAPQDDAPEALTSSYSLEPANGAWLRFSPSALRIQFHDGPVNLLVEESSLRLDGEPRTFSWDGSRGTLESVIRATLADGSHAVEASLAHGGGGVTKITWSFGLDTRVPELEIAPLPPSSENRSLPIHGQAHDEGLVDVLVQGRPVELVDGNFSTTVLLWPGLNDISVEAQDRAGNLRRALETVRLETPAYEGALEAWTLTNNSFGIAVPANWAAQENILLTSGARADLVAAAPLQPGLQTTVAVVSDPTTVAFSRSRALEWMDLLLAGVEAGGQLQQVISQPRLLEDGPGTVAVQSTFLRRTAADLVAFTQVTMVWSLPAHRQWIVLGVTDARRALEAWPALNASVGSFRVLDKALGEAGNLEGQILFSTVLVVAAILVLVGALGVVLVPTYLAWRRKKNEGRWRPPRNWRL